MAIKINFDSANIPERPTLLLAKKDGSILGQLQTSSLRIKDCLNDTPELYFEVYKNAAEDLWDDIDNFKLVWVKEANLWFDITVSTEESTEGIKKSVNCVGLGNSELSQIYLREIEINTEDDIAREDYDENYPTIFYNPNRTSSSLLHRITEKAPHYSFGQIDTSLRCEQRVFSFDGETLLDALNDIAEEIQCIFDIKVVTDSEGQISRTINAYDLLNYCTECHHREENMTACPECGSTNILSGYGTDTTIFVTSDELASSIVKDSDTDSVKNCFYLTAGDDTMTSAIRDCNPNGSSYIWYIPQYMRNEMSDDLQNALSNYESTYEKYLNNTTDSSLIEKISDKNVRSSYNALWARVSRKYGNNYVENLICTLYDGEEDRAFYIKCLNKDTAKSSYFIEQEIANTDNALVSWVTIKADSAMWNLPLICVKQNSDNMTYGYYFGDAGLGYVIAHHSIIVEGETWWYNSNSQACPGKVGNTAGFASYLGIFDSMAKAAKFLIENVYYHPNSHNLIARKNNTLLERYENDSNIVDENYKHQDIEELPYYFYNYQNLIKGQYEVVDLQLQIESSLMPTVTEESTETTITKQIAIVNGLSGSTVAVKNDNLDNVSQETILSATKNFLKWHINSNYKITVNASSTFKSGNTFYVDVTLEPYSSLTDEEEQTCSISLNLSNDAETYYQNKIKSTLVNEVDNEEIYYDIVSLFSYAGTAEFSYVLMLFSYNKLKSIADACQSCLDVLISQGVTEDTNPDLYNNIYIPYYNKNIIINNELEKRSTEKTLEENVAKRIAEIKSGVQTSLDISKYLTQKSVWEEFCSFRREDEYNNSNYVSDGLTNSELLQKANEFIEVATKELHKAAIVQHSISTTLNNLLVIPKFEPLVSMFEVGNWIRLEMDDTNYKLRLVDYEIDFNNLESITVNFSDVTTAIDSYTDIQDILSQASSIATSYDYVARQAKNGDNGRKIIDNWTALGLDATNIKLIGGADNQSQTWDEHGMLFREYLPDLDDWDDRQLKIINSTIAITDDNWEHIKTAVGRFLYVDPTDGKTYEAYGVNAETLVGKLIIGENLGIYNSDTSILLDNNGITIKNSTGETVFSASPKGTLSIGSGLISQDSVDGLKETYLTASSKDITDMKKDIGDLTSDDYKKIKDLATDLDNNLTIPTLSFKQTTIGDGTSIMETTYNSGVKDEKLVTYTTLITTSSTGETILATDVGSKGNYTAISSDGVLIANNAVIFGELRSGKVTSSYISGSQFTLVKDKTNNGRVVAEDGGDVFAVGYNIYNMGSGYTIGSKKNDWLLGTIGDINYLSMGGSDNQILMGDGKSTIALSGGSNSFTMAGSDNQILMAGYLNFYSNGSNNWGTIGGLNFNKDGMHGFYTSTTIGSNTFETYSGFRYIETNAGAVFYAGSDGSSTGSSARFRVDYDGNTVIENLQVHNLTTYNTSGNDDFLDIHGSEHYSDNTYYIVGMTSNCYDGSQGDPYNPVIFINHNTQSWKFFVRSNGEINSAVGLAGSSDKKLKNHLAYIEDMVNVEDFFMNLKPVSFKWKNDGRRTHLGFYAQDVAENAKKTIGDLALYKAMVINKETNDGYFSEDIPDEELSWSLMYDEFIPITVFIVQKQQNRIEALEKEIEELKAVS